MHKVDLYDFLDEIEKRERELGVEDSLQASEQLRNRGGSGLPAKREMLRRAAERARNTIIEPVRSYF